MLIDLSEREAMSILAALSTEVIRVGGHRNARAHYERILRLQERIGELYIAGEDHEPVKPYESVRCPVCHAGAGEPCERLSLAEQYAYGVHQRRVRAYYRS